MRHDDGAGLLVAERAAELEVQGQAPVAIALAPPVGDPLDLLWSWDGAEAAVIADATRSGSAPGTLSFAWIARDGECQAVLSTKAPTSHGFGVAGAYRVARAVGRGPRQLAVVGIEGLDFSQGEGLTAPVAAAVPAAARLLLHVAGRVANHTSTERWHLGQGFHDVRAPRTDPMEARGRKKYR
jgi:hydrogenase maturation protease